ncbi:MAG: M20/M25/M40 family metallo-hydrolase [Firmicutes bacterium]|nr:M20/M25/M40 family metallo-hydrolase [Bacillota bacterium]
MYEELIQKIDERIEAARADVAAMTIDLVNIKSVEEDPLPGAPFGAGPRKVLDRVMEMGKDIGLHAVDYNVGVVSIAMEDAEPDLGIWIHGDVVPEGVGWIYEPYNAVEYKGCVIGRGVTDNKGQFAAAYHVLKIFKELNIELNYNPAIYVGSNEESGMKDLLGMPGNPDAKGFLNVCTPPKISFVPDTSFPAGCMGKGALRLLVRSKTPLKNFTFIAGQDEAPGRATAVFPPQANFPETLPECNIEKREDGSIVVTADSPPVHGTRPDPNGNMITKLSAALLEYCDMSDSERTVMEFFKRTSKDVYGTLMGLEVINEEMGNLTVFSKRADFDDDYPALYLDIRYPIDITWPEIKEKVEAAAAEFDFEIAGVYRGANPYKMEPNPEIMDTLCRASEDVLCEKKKPFCVTGNAYGHYLPNAYAFGMNGNLPPEDFPKGHGGAHGIDEAVSLDRLDIAMRIYARALLALNDVELCGSEPLEIRACQRDRLCPIEK